MRFIDPVFDSRYVAINFGKFEKIKVVFRDKTYVIADVAASFDREGTFDSYIIVGDRSNQRTNRAKMDKPYDAYILSMNMETREIRYDWQLEPGEIKMAEDTIKKNLANGVLIRKPLLKLVLGQVDYMEFVDFH